MSIRNLLKGTGVAIVTPFKEDESVDFDALASLINFQLERGIEYIVSLGTTGESPVLDNAEKKDIVAFTIETIKGRVPVVVGIGGNSTRSVVETLRHFPLQGATAVLSVAPYYNKPSQEGLFRHYQEVAAASPLPVIMYNVPGRTGRNMEATTTIRLAHEVKNIAGIKEAASSVQQCMQLLRDRPSDFLVVSGDDDLVLTEMAAGIDGVISVAANCFPDTFSSMVRAGLAGDFFKARQLNEPLMQAYHLLFAENNPAGVKAFLAEMGLIRNVLRLPLVPLSESLMKQVKAYLKK